MFSFTFYWENFVFKSTGKKEFSGTFNGHYTFLGKKKSKVRTLRDCIYVIGSKLHHMALPYTVKYIVPVILNWDTKYETYATHKLKHAFKSYLEYFVALLYFSIFFLFWILADIIKVSNRAWFIEES